MRLLIVFITFYTTSIFADENLFGYIRGAETLPKGSSEIYQVITSRQDKGQGTFQALDLKTEFEYGFTDKFTIGSEIKMQSIYSKNILIDAYIPRDIETGLKISGFEIYSKYNFLSPAKDDIGLSAFIAYEQNWLDKHSGQKKNSRSFYFDLLVQKYLSEGEFILVGNVGIESTYARRAALANLPADFEWPTIPEMEIALKLGTGVSYRFVENWFIGTEAIYETEYETEVGQERYSTFVGPSIHYGGQHFWTTLTYFRQINGGPFEDGQADKNLHLIEKTKYELRLKVGFDF